METSEYRLVNQGVLGRAIQELEGLPLTGSYTVTIKESKHTSGQRKLAHKWLGIVADEIGEDKEEYKQKFKIEHKYYDVLMADGIPYIIIKSTKDLSVKEYSEFMNKIEIRARELNIILPQPNYYGYERR